MKPEVKDMSISEKFINELEMLNENERQEVLERIPDTSVITSIFSPLTSTPISYLVSTVITEC